jgi:undecaprenyl-diphosphatase
VPSIADVIRALILGVVEGATEFVPVSSTGHLILAGHLIGFTGTRATLFDVFIQLGAILAVVWNFRDMLRRWVDQAIGRQAGTAGGRRLFENLGLAFLPATVIGFVAHRWVTAHLFRPEVVASTLVAGGLAILLVERLRPATSADELIKIPRLTALGIGLAQVLSLVPGVSRAAATIMAGVALGVSRPAATEFSFLLAIPIMFAATGLAGAGSISVIAPGDVLVFAAGFVSAFASGLIAIRLLLRFVAQHSFVPFAWYRIGLGLLVLLFVRSCSL